MKRCLIGFVGGLLLFGLSCTGVWTQSVSQISGTIRDQTGAALPGAAAPSTAYLNAAAFVLPALGRLGNAGANSVVGPKIWQVDASLSRTLRVGETRRVEVRAEAYNVTNGFRAQNPITNISNANFGKILSSGDPRILQFALKYIF